MALEVTCYSLVILLNHKFRPARVKMMKRLQVFSLRHISVGPLCVCVSCKPEIRLCTICIFKLSVYLWKVCVCVKTLPQFLAYKCKYHNKC